jgi:NADH dehydrogenase FAD-containing subunit
VPAGADERKIAFSGKQITQITKKSRRMAIRQATAEKAPPARAAVVAVAGAGAAEKRAVFFI